MIENKQTMKTGRPLEYGEATEIISFRVPSSKAKELKEIMNNILAKYKKPSNKEGL